MPFVFTFWQMEFDADHFLPTLISFFNKSELRIRHKFSIFYCLIRCLQAISDLP